MVVTKTHQIIALFLHLCFSIFHRVVWILNSLTGLLEKMSIFQQTQ